MVRNEILRQVSSPHETPRFPKHFADFRAFEINLKKVEDFCCRQPNDVFNSLHRRQSSRRRNDKNMTNENIISAAPELLLALKSLTLEIESILSHEAGKTRDQLMERLHMDYDGKLRAARFAISKANGRTN